MILITGGAGFIGSHTTLLLLQAGHEVVVVDNLCNSSAEAIARVGKLAGRSPTFIQGDIRDRALLSAVFAQNKINAVVHFAGFKAVGESARLPLDYYDNNVGGTINLCQVMRQAGVFRLVFSSSSTVYGDPAKVPIAETAPMGALSALTNPYGRSKLIVEDILRDTAASDARWSVGILRYFNPAGAHESGQIGEAPQGVPNNLLPYITQVAVGKLKQLSVFGNDYPTPDGTAIRDYIHVIDLAHGHLAALDKINRTVGAQVWNLGTGVGYSVLEVVRAFEAASGQKIPFTFMPRRVGDVAVCYANPRKAQEELGWRAQRTLADMMTSAWRWQSQNPEGYSA